MRVRRKSTRDTWRDELIMRVTVVARLWRRAWIRGKKGRDRVARVDETILFFRRIEHTEKR